MLLSVNANIILLYSRWKLWLFCSIWLNRTSAKWAEFTQNLCLLDCRYRATTSYNQSFRERQSCFAFHILIRALYLRVVLPTSWVRFDPFQLKIVYPSNWKSFQLLTVSHFVLKPKSYHFPMHCMKSLRRQVVVVSLYSLVLLCKICKCLS